MSTRHSQAGISFIGGLLALAVLAFVVSTGLKIGPHYMDYWALVKVMDGAAVDANDRVESADDFYNRLSRGMQVNNIRDLDLKKALSITEQADGFKARLQYEKREPLIRNIDLVVKFDHETSVRTP